MLIGSNSTKGIKFKINFVHVSSGRPQIGPVHTLFRPLTAGDLGLGGTLHIKLQVTCEVSGH